MPAEQLTTSKNLSDLLQGFAHAPEMSVQGVASDSRRLGKGYLFLACGGAVSHGLDYLDSAISAGVAAVAYDSETAQGPAADPGVPVIAVPGLAHCLGEIANRFYVFPSQALRVVGVTGTNGKTTVAWLLSQCIELLGHRCGYIGTLGSGLGEVAGAEGMTTPGAVELHGCLADFRDAGAEFAALEISSHALDQDRVDGVEFDTVMFTNLTRDHLDYHGDMHAYAEAKARLFLDYPARHRIINLDSEFGAELAARCGEDVVTVSTHPDRIADSRPYVFAHSVVPKSAGSLVSISTAWGDGSFNLPMPGDFNVANAVIVLAALLRHGVELAAACDVLSAVKAPPGRMQHVDATGELPAVYVDYAHSPAALEGALRALQAHCNGALWCVFGCGGDRDAGKRPIMGRIAERLADRVVVTNDNPRSEAPDSIVADILDGLTKITAATVIEDRGAAIAWAIRTAAPTDVVLVAGKGHENYQLIGADRIDFSDYGVALASLEALGKASE